MMFGQFWKIEMEIFGSAQGTLVCTAMMENLLLIFRNKHKQTNKQNQRTSNMVFAKAELMGIIEHLYFYQHLCIFRQRYFKCPALAHSLNAVRHPGNIKNTEHIKILKQKKL